MAGLDFPPITAFAGRGRLPDNILDYLPAEFAFDGRDSSFKRTYRAFQFPPLILLEASNRLGAAIDRFTKRISQKVDPGLKVPGQLPVPDQDTGSGNFLVRPPSTT